MRKFLIRNDDVAFDTSFAEITKFCQICDSYGYQIIQAIIPIGEAKKIKSRMTNDQIKTTSSKLFSENQEVLDYLSRRQDLIGVHGLWHTHGPTEEEITRGKNILTDLGFNPTYFVPPFNEGDYPENFAGLKTCQLSEKSGERLEDYLKEGTPKGETVYLHSWRFDNAWYTFDMLDQCLHRLSGKSK